MMKKLTATYRIVTPMFIGDAEQKATSIRPSAIKGALRFWWRALNWGKYLEREKADVSKALSALHTEEARLFGSAVENNKGGQGVFWLKVIKQPPPKATQQAWPESPQKGQKKEAIGSSYFGFGLWADKTNPQHRESFIEGNTFSLSFCFKPKTALEDIQEIKKTLKVLSLFGGLGGRSRRGFGSVCLTELIDTEKTERFDDSLLAYREKTRQVINHYHDVKEVPYTAFSRYARFEIVEQGLNSREIHGNAGYAYKQYRGNLKKAEKIPFGLPLKEIDENRRASPLLYHIHPVQEHRFVVGVLYLPAVFHHIKPEYRTNHFDAFYRPITDFLNKEAIE
ncbi:MAG: type III-B CRISPR module RAMP protein Cmr1 [Candidatus Parabeggiatoa sp.]|nr:type III-B CRISPR module RAMP protein Cmr1 [Candidatus Parabeggiatoa sp.]